MFLSAPQEVGRLSFAKAGEERSYAQTAFDATVPGAPGPPAAALWDSTSPAAQAQRDLFWAAERETRLAHNIASLGEAMAEAADQRIETARRLTGTALENPFRAGYLNEAQERIDAERAGGTYIDPSAEGPRLAEEQRRVFDERLAALAEAHPEAAGALGGSLDTQAGAIASAAEDAAGTARERAAGLGLGSRFLTEIGGSLWGSRRDPLFLASLFAGPGLSTARSVVARVVQSSLIQGGFNAGLTAVEQPAVQAFRAERGRPSGLAPALHEIALAGAAGAVLGGAIQGGVEAVRGAAKRALAGRAEPGGAASAPAVPAVPEPGTAPAAAPAAKVAADPVTARVVKAGEDSVRADAAAPRVLPGLAPESRGDLLAQAVRHAEDPAHRPPPEIPVVAPDRPPDQVRIVDEREPLAIGADETIDGKPAPFRRLDPREIATDAAAFQYKGGADDAGITGRLRELGGWDAFAAGKGIVFERRDGRRFVVDGHQRLGLAHRLIAAEPEARINFDAHLLREADGWTPADARALAAKKNMQEGSGEAMDAARVLRDRPDLLDNKLPVSGPMMRKAIGLARLSDEAWGMAINGVVPEDYAAALGNMAPDPASHGAIMADLVPFPPATEREARLLIGEAMAGGFRSEQQIGLFGPAALARSLIGERVKVLDEAMKALSADKRVFGMLAGRADTIEAAGNVLDRAGNVARAGSAIELGELVARLARRTGPVSDALNRAAAEVAAGGKAGAAARGFLDEVEALIARDGLKGLDAAPESRPPAPAAVEPGTKAAAEAAPGGGAGAAVPAGPTGARAQADILDLMPVAKRADAGDTRLTDRAEALDAADRKGATGDFADACKE